MSCLFTLEHGTKITGATTDILAKALETSG